MGTVSSSFWLFAEMKEGKLMCLFKGKSASVSHSRSSSLVLDKDVSRLMDVNLPWSARVTKERTKADKEKKAVAAGKENVAAAKKDAQAAPSRSGHGHSRSQSQPKLQLPLERTYHIC